MSRFVFAMLDFHWKALLCVVLSHSSWAQVATPTVPSYSPMWGNCPVKQPLLRLSGTAMHANQTLCSGEASYREGRRRVTAPLWRDFFASGIGAKAGYGDTFLTEEHQDWPTLALAHSGGGLRAALYGAGVVKALNGETSSSPVRGVLQLLTYHTGLSGGSWLVMSLATHDFAPVDDLVPRWQLEKDMVLPGGINPYFNSKYLDNIFDTAEIKKDAGFKTSLTDLWSLALSRHFLPGTAKAKFYEHSSEASCGSGILFSGLRKLRGLREFKSPLPIIVSDSLPPPSSRRDMRNQLPVQGSTVVPLSTTIYESTPFEFGSFDPYLSAFTPMEYLGSHLYGGKPINSTSCVTAFDQAGFVMGTSATLFNGMFSETDSGDISSRYKGLNITYANLFKLVTKRISGSKSVRGFLTAQYPSPFKGVNGPSTFEGSDQEYLTVVDGGENGENIALNPLLAPARQVDVIIAADGSADTSDNDPRGANWPNGASLINTFTRVTRALPPGSAYFPEVPPNAEAWDREGFTTRPTFFGCKPRTGKSGAGFPLVIYIPNTPLPQGDYKTNTSTFKLQYSKSDQQGFIDSAMKTATSSIINSKADGEWPTCLSCALIDRLRSRKGVAQTEVCKRCFSRYCYTGSKS